MHPDTAATKVDQAHRDLVEHVLRGPEEDENGRSGELQALANVERGPGVQEVLTAQALAELARQVAELRQQVTELKKRSSVQRSSTKKKAPA